MLKRGKTVPETRDQFSGGSEVMKSYKEMSKEELKAELEGLNEEYQKYLAMNLDIRNY